MRLFDLLIDRLIAVHTHVRANEIATRSHYFYVFTNLRISGLRLAIWAAKVIAPIFEVAIR